MVTSISTILIPCLKSLNRICEHSQHDHEDDVSSGMWIDELGRLRVWAANIGAHQTGQSSFEFRLRDASHISQQIINLLSDLDPLLASVRAKLFGQGDHELEEGVDPDSEDEESRGSDIQQLYGEVVNIIDCLYQLSMLIRRPAQHDLLVGSSKSDMAEYEPFDREHARNKFPNADDAIVQRLGRAITQRRKHLKYRERHNAKLGKGIDEVQGIERATTDSLVSETIATEFNTENIKFEETSSNSGASQTSYAPSLGAGGITLIPPLPKELAAGKPSECPYCFFVIEIASTRSWIRHIFRDTRPYVCVFSECSTPDRLYDSRREWFFHEIRDHHAESDTCPLCKSPQASKKGFERHTARHLEELALFALPRPDSNDDESTNEFDAVSGNALDDISSESPEEKIEADDGTEPHSGKLGESLQIHDEYPCSEDETIRQYMHMLNREKLVAEGREQEARLDLAELREQEARLDASRSSNEASHQSAEGTATLEDGGH